MTMLEKLREDLAKVRVRTPTPLGPRRRLDDDVDIGLLQPGPPTSANRDRRPPVSADTATTRV